MIRRAALLLSLAGLFACGDDPEPTSREALMNGTYLSDAVPDGEVTLVGGAFDFPPGSEVSRVELLLHAEGDLDGDDEADGAAVLLENAGTSSIFRLHALLSDGRSTSDVAARMIGEGIVLRTLTIDDGIITAGLVIRGEREPRVVRPSVPISMKYALTRDGLLPIDPPRLASDQGEEPTPDARGGPADGAGADDAEAGPGGATVGPTLTSHEWRLASIEMGDWSMSTGARETPPSLRFAIDHGALEGADHRVYGYDGCNRLFGSYRAEEDGALRIRGLALTRRACRGEEQELEERVLASLLAARSFDIAGGELTISFDGGVMRFDAGGELTMEPAADALLAPPDEESRAATRRSA